MTQLTVRDLRRRWKPHKERLGDSDTSVRFHRSCSWLQRAMRVEGNSEGKPCEDERLIFGWIALNAMYGQWDSVKREPAPDWRSLCDFTTHLVSIDAQGRLAQVLTEHRKLVMALLGDAYVNRYFWSDPSQQQAAKSVKAKYDAPTWYLEERWRLILDRVLERVYLVRCQLVHGGATYESTLNRTAVRRCATLLELLLLAMLEVFVDHGADEDWGASCYRPVRDLAEAGGG